VTTWEKDAAAIDAATKATQNNEKANEKAKK
jgi:hypothetical protein